MTDEPNVISLRGGEVVDTREACTATVEGLERMLEMARNGEIVGYIMVALSYDGATYSSGRGRGSWSMVGRLESEKLDMIASLNA